MSFEYNRVSVAGNLTRDAEVRTTSNGKPQVTFTVANNRSGREQQQVTTFFRCIWFGEVAGKLAQYLRKGKPVFVSGPVELNEYEKDGTKYSNIQILVQDLQLVPDGKGNTSQSDTGSSDDAAPIDDDDVPF